MCEYRIWAAFLCVLLGTASVFGASREITFRPAPGVTAYLNHPGGEALNLELDVRDWNLFENRPVELLVKVTAPDGSVAVREVIEDDGVVGEAFGPPAGGWGHDRNYYAVLQRRGIAPMLRHSALTEPARVQALAKRTFRWTVEGEAPGAYRVMVVGSRDHIVTLRTPAETGMGLAGHPLWIHGHGDMFETAYVYVPRGTIGLSFGIEAFDLPTTRRLKVTAPDGTVLWDDEPTGGRRTEHMDLDAPGQYDEQVLKVQVEPGKGDYRLHLHAYRDDTRRYRGRHGSVPALFVDDPETARALRGGAIYHDGEVYWHAFQVRFHDWLKTLDDEDFVVRNEAGEVIEPVVGGRYGWSARSYVLRGLGSEPHYVPLNGNHEAPPLSDDILHHYPAHRNRQALNLALRDLHEGLRMLAVGDIPVVSPLMFGNLGYNFATYGWHYWRPAWRVIQHSDAPPEVKAIVREAMIQSGDRLAFARGGERVNGNAMSHIVMALRYAAEATQDPLHLELSDLWLDRFTSEGWGRRTGIGPSGDCQEHFAHDFHYGTYILANYRAVVTDLGDQRFAEITNRIRALYRYLWAPGVLAYPWSSRTSQSAGAGRNNWHGEPGDDFTVSVNDGDEWFAARRSKYYLLTYHGRLVPDHLNEQFGSKIGYGGGIICQLTVPGHGPVLASVLANSYGRGMEVHRWRTFRIHSVVGEMIDGSPVVAADSEHLNAALVDQAVSGSGEVRHAPLHITRGYEYHDDHITCRLMLSPTKLHYRQRERQTHLREAWEMIPYAVPGRSSPPRIAWMTSDDQWEDLGDDELVETTRVRVDRGEFGVDIVFSEARKVRRGRNTTVLVRLIDEPTSAWEIAMAYELHPWVK